MKLIHSISTAMLLALTHPLTAAPVEQTYLTQPGNVKFGQAVAISGDTMVVGAPAATVGGVAAGAAYVYIRSGGSWTQQAMLTASNPNANDTFGEAVAILGDRIVVGAPGEASNATGANGNQADNSLSGDGAVYIFARNGTTWTQQTYLKATKAQFRLGFGASVAIKGTTVVVGAATARRVWLGEASQFSGDDSNAAGVDGNENDNSLGRAGAVFVYEFTGSRWYLEAYLKASNPDSFDSFGSSIAFDGNLIVVGAPGEASAATEVNGNQADNSLPWAGAVYVFGRGSSGAWTQEAYLKADAQVIGGIGFGFSVALSGNTVAVGNGFGDYDYLEGGKAWVFTRSPAGVWTHQQTLTPLLATGPYFGYSVALLAIPWWLANLPREIRISILPRSTARAMPMSLPAALPDGRGKR